jgi:hypothetical protein
VADTPSGIDAQKATVERVKVLEAEVSDLKTRIEVLERLAADRH